MDFGTIAAFSGAVDVLPPPAAASVATVPRPTPKIPGDAGCAEGASFS